MIRKIVCNLAESQQGSVLGAISAEIIADYHFFTLITDALCQESSNQTGFAASSKRLKLGDVADKRPVFKNKERNDIKIVILVSLIE